MLLNNPRIKEEFTMKTGKCFELNENENTTYQLKRIWEKKDKKCSRTFQKAKLEFAPLSIDSIYI